MQRRLSLIIVALILTAAIPVFAQSTGPNGGLLAGTKGHQTELVVSPTELTVYLLENGKAHDSKGVALRAVIQQAGKTTTVSFVDDNGRRLVAKLPGPLDKGAIVVLTGKDDHGDPLSARYVIR